MKVTFRADASLRIGTGHVMRCLTLADALKTRGAECRFICREFPGNLIEFIRGKSFPVQALPDSKSTDVRQPGSEPLLAHRTWLGATQRQDAAQSVPALAAWQPDWLIVDHYALDAQWEKGLNPHYLKLMVIDDLADREHQCELLLDQTFGRSTADYAAWVPANCRLLCGSQYALLRPEFSALRPYSLRRRANPQLRKLLITMGGVDKDNATGTVLSALRSCELPADCRITVVMGASNPWLAEVQHKAEQLPWATDVRVDVSDMAQLMADSDLAIGAAGATSWERCCLGLPTVMVVLAENQRAVAQGLEQAGAVQVLHGCGQIHDRLPRLLSDLVASPALRVTMSRISAGIADGGGVAAVIRHLES